MLADYLDGRMDYIPLNFMLGFFVSVVINRWTTLFTNIGLIDKYAKVRGSLLGLHL